MLRYGANGLVALGEKKLRGEKVSVDEVAKAAAGLILQAGGENLDTVVLACTHFPLLQDELQEAFGKDVTFVDGSNGIARRIAQLLEGQSFGFWPRSIAVTTGELDDFKRLSGVFEQHGIKTLKRF